ncbi:DUF4145 domain-containing protein [Priestia megaterium]|uniref:DUF4145 domain-containing protein n=1 Tax=Priestia megaterium TaxID=1404 RepID=A0A6H1P4T9_PRIMG|nr:DUF4145 domain-containing protein [Priestia megaterium]QIZ08462.1 DUF4145 domain-containing protein [Priestia megaterium]
MNNRLFDFVRQFSNELADLADRIEDHLWDQPHATLTQARLYCEEIVKKVSNTEGIENIYPLKPAERIYKLYKQDIISEDIYMKLEWIRKMGNKAAHNVKEIVVQDVLEAHKLLFEISVWYMEVYVSHQFNAQEYKLPAKTNQDTNVLGVNDINELIKPYFDQTLQRFDEMRAEIQLQLEAIKVEKEKDLDINTKAVNIQQSEIKAPTETLIQKQDEYHIRLQFRGETILLTSKLAKTPILDLPVVGCNYLLRELSRVGIDSLVKITEPMDSLHLKLNGIGPNGMEKFWNLLISLQDSVMLELEQDNSTEEENNSIELPEEKIPLRKEKENIVRIFEKNNFDITNETPKAIEFEHAISKEIVYLLANKETSVVLHPTTVQKDDFLKSNGKDRSSTALRKFPKEQNKGKSPINHGFLFKFSTASELDTFFNRFNEIICLPKQFN